MNLVNNFVLFVSGVITVASIMDLVGRPWLGRYL